MTENDNKRRYPRIKAPASQRVAWRSGTLRNLSLVDNLGMGGLFIRTKTPAAVGAIVQLLIPTERGEIRLRAIVRSTVAGKGMGVAIAAMEPEDRGRLDRWLRQLSEPQSKT
ncbi:MAG TPA: PilZ domain-containing protein [Dongiaceae bacterium]|nr:PilZ domain-containing protein [Dongiaceae bacterium]